MRIAYFVQDLADPAVGRRVEIFRRGGAEVDLYGFRRTETPRSEVAGVRPRDLGRTRDGRLAERALSVIARRFSLGKWAKDVAGADLVIARNLETLVLAAAARRRYAVSAPLVYELLDIHSLMLRRHAIAELLRRFEGRLVRECAAIMISSPAFDRNYLLPVHPDRVEPILVENKVFLPTGSAPPVERRPDCPPWRIGWYGIIRCKRSLDCLSRLVQRFPGQVEVDIWGRIADTDMGDLDAILRGTPGLTFHGAYKYPDDLARIYATSHFVWAIDFYEAGGNSDWLLPNRLYEGGLHGVVPIALSTVETGRWLERHGVGYLVDPVRLDEELDTFITTLTPERYRDLAGALDGLDRSLFLWTDEECRRLVDDLGGLALPTDRR